MTTDTLTPDPFRARRSSVLLVGCIWLLWGAPASAAEISELQGAWIINSAECSSAFTKRNGRFAFKPNQRNADTSFIINGNRLQGARATCSLDSEKRTSDGFRAVLNCASQIMIGALPVSFWVPNPNTIVKFDPDFPELETTFTRCE
jgi:hypothetical protein